MSVLSTAAMQLSSKSSNFPILVVLAHCKIEADYPKWQFRAARIVRSFEEKREREKKYKAVAGKKYPCEKLKQNALLDPELQILLDI